MRAIVRKDISNSYFTLKKGTEVEVINEIVSDADTIAKDNWIDTDKTKKIAERNRYILCKNTSYDSEGKRNFCLN